MDFTTIIGIFSGLALIVIAIMMRAGGIATFWNLPSVFITFGGAFAATLVNYPIKQVVNVFKIAAKVFTAKEEDTQELIDNFVDFAKKARRMGVMELEKDIKNIQNDFLRRGVELVVAGADQERIRTELETELTFIQERHKIGQEIFIALGTYCPAFGMIGTIMGLILMLARIEDQSQIATGMAVALLTTFYGAVAGYLIFLPIAGKLKRRSADELLVKEVIIRGVLSLQSGEIPSVVEAKLKAYLPPKMRKAKKKAPPPPAGKKEAPKKEEKKEEKK